MKTLIVLLVVAVLAGCSYSTRFHVGKYGMAHTASVTTHEFE